MIFKRDQSNIKCLYLLLDVRKSMYDKFATYIITYFQCYTDEEPMVCKLEIPEYQYNNINTFESYWRWELV